MTRRRPARRRLREEMRLECGLRGYRARIGKLVEHEYAHVRVNGNLKQIRGQTEWQIKKKKRVAFHNGRLKDRAHTRQRATVTRHVPASRATRAIRLAVAR